MTRIQRCVALSSARQTRHICGGIGGSIGGRAITPQGTRGFGNCQILVSPSSGPDTLSSPR